MKDKAMNTISLVCYRTNPVTYKLINIQDANESNKLA